MILKLTNITNLFNYIFERNEPYTCNVGYHVLLLLVNCLHDNFACG